MATVQVILRRKANAQGLFPIAIRITKNRKTSYIFTGQYIDDKFWDKKNKKIKRSHPNSTRLNHLILTKLAQANEKLIDSEVKNDAQNVYGIKKKIIGKVKKDFFKIAQEYLDDLEKAQKFNQLNAEKSRIKKFKAFMGNRELPFSELDIRLLRQFKTHLVVVEKKSTRTAMNYLLIIRTIYNRAIAESIANRDTYPFGKGKVQIKFPESEKIGLSILEIKLLENIEDLTIAQQHVLNIWLLSFYFAGIRVADILQLKWSDFRDKRLYYRMGKNKKLVSLKIPNKAIKILMVYKMTDKPKGLVFPYLKDNDFLNKKKLAVRIHTITRNFNRHLKEIAIKTKIDKNLTMHIARHSFGNISGDKIPIQILQKLYRHSSVTTTINYQANFMRSVTDDALDKVVNF
ncbi:MAG: site-specific integrase [Candidatus Lokiarchaeia archaeon]